MRDEDLVVSQNRDANALEEELELEKLIVKYNPEQELLYYLLRYIDEHDFSGDSYYNVGYDSLDGMTWFN